MTPWFLETMIATTAIMIVVLILRVPVARLLGARAVYLLWAAPALRMILPPLPQSWFGSPILPGGADTSAVFVGAAPLLQIGTAGDSPAVDWIFILLALWLSGAAIFFGTHMMRYRRFKRAVMAEAAPLHSEGRIPVSTSNLISSPIALGIFGRAVVVPADFAERFDRIEQRLALHHEVTHHQRGDLPVNLCALAILSLHWFNPIAHFAHRAFRLDQEAACDAIVLSGADADERHAYGSALYKSATGTVPFGVCAMGTTATLKARLRGILARSARPERLITGSLLGLAVIGSSLLLTASIGRASPDGEDKPVGQPTATPQAEPGAATGEEAAALGQQEADLGEAEAKIAEEEAANVEQDISEVERNAKRDAINSSRRAIQDARRRLAALPIPPAPPAPPVPPSTPAGFVAPERPVQFGESPGAAPDLQRKSGNVDCPESAHHRQIVSANVDRVQVVVIDCDGKITTLTNASNHANLIRARARIDAIEALTKTQRSIAMDAIDKAMKQLKAEPPPFSLQ